VTIGKPYVDLVLEDKKIRTFDMNATQDEYEWHRDLNNRQIEVLEGEGWMLQFDNKMPMPLSIGDQVTIPEGVFHRVYKGNTPLKISIREYNG
jgi:oxalate decarboxylase/phosphoglucose isomerase-like protein (cupin superfamily)